MTKVGEINLRVIEILNLDIEPGTPIFIGKSNVLHMSRSHPSDYKEYRNHIPDIIENPDFVGINPKDDSIEYVKIFDVDGKFVKVAVRVSQGGVCYARTIYARDLEKMTKFIEKGLLFDY
jgi:hypothetical protein